MKLSRRAGATSQIFQIFIADKTSATGAGLTGLVFNTASLTAYFHRDTDTTATAISLVTMTVGTFTSSGFKEVDSTNMPGWYQFCPPNTALASGAASVGFHLKGGGNMADLPIEVDLDSQVDVYLWNGTAVATPATAGIPDINVKNINNVAAATPGASGGILISGSNSGTTTLGALTCTGSFTVSDGFLVSRSSSNTSAITATGNGTGSGIVATSGSGATGDGMQMTAVSTAGRGVSLTGAGSNGYGLLATGAAAAGARFAAGGVKSGIECAGSSSGAGIQFNGGSTGQGMLIAGGGTSGVGVSITTTSGDGLSITPTVGHGITSTGNGTTKHGINATGGATSSDGIRATGGGTGNGINSQSGVGATGDGILAVSNATAGNGMTLTHAGTGKDLNATTTLLALANLDAAVSSRLASASYTAPDNASIGSIKTQTDKFAFTVANQVDANIITKTGFSLTSVYDPAKTASQAGDAMALTSAERTAIAGVFFTTDMTEAYPALGGALTPSKALYELVQHHSEKSIIGTIMTLKRRDQSTPAKTFTLNDATNPSAVTEAT